MVTQPEERSSPRMLHPSPTGYGFLLFRVGWVCSLSIQRGDHHKVSCLLYGTLFLIVKCTSGGLHLKGFRRDVFVMTRAAQTKASYHEFEKQILLNVKSSKISLNKTSKTLCNGIWQKQLLILKLEKGFLVDQTIFSWLQNMDQVSVKWSCEN